MIDPILHHDRRPDIRHGPYLVRGWGQKSLARRWHMMTTHLCPFRRLDGPHDGEDLLGVAGHRAALRRDEDYCAPEKTVE